MEDERITAALDLIKQFGSTDGAHHKMWVIDQAVRILTGCPEVDDMATDYRGRPYTFKRLGESDEYRAWVAAYETGDGEQGARQWDTGIAP